MTTAKALSACLSLNFLKEKTPIVSHIPIHEMHGAKHFKELLYKGVASIREGRRVINEEEEIIW